jgi:transcriptional regulator with XRE-family HTH domain
LSRPYPLILTASRTEDSKLAKIIRSGDLIRTRREQRGWKQEDLAAAAGTTAQQISRLETGARQLTEKWLGRLARALGCATADLLPETSRVTRTEPRPRDGLRLDSTEIMLLDFWRSLSVENQYVILKIVNGWAVATVSQGDRGLAKTADDAEARFIARKS